MPASQQKVIPHLWFDDHAEAAANFYTSAFDDARLGAMTRYGTEGFEIHGQPEGKVMTVEFEIAGYHMLAINGGPIFTITPAISFMVTCETVGEVNALWDTLSDGGQVLMGIDSYPWSDRYGWVQDRYGVSWQLYRGTVDRSGQRISPTLMFVGAQLGRAEEAINLYTSTFPGSSIDGVLRYGANSGEAAGMVQHSSFRLGDDLLMAMDGPGPHQFTFTEAVCLLVPCDSQEEIDHYWNALTAGGDPAAQQCGWLKDRFGVSWQVTPVALLEMMKDPDPKRVARVTKAFLQMKKLDLAELQRVYKGG